MEEKCLFCRLGKSNSSIFRDDICYVIPDKFPSEFGHILVISEDHYENMLSAPDDVAAHMFIVAKNYGIKLKNNLKSEGINITTNIGREAGQLINHFHIHIIPRYANPPKWFRKHAELKSEDVNKLKSILA